MSSRTDVSKCQRVNSLQKVEMKHRRHFLGSRTAAARVFHAPEVRHGVVVRAFVVTSRRFALFIASGVPLWEERRIHADTI